MTIRARNRFNIIFLISSIVILLSNITLFSYHFFTGKLVIPEFESSGFFLFRYEFWSVIASIFTINLYVTTAAYLIWRTFEKTQATEVLFFLLFLAALLLNSTRLYVPIFGLNGSYSSNLISLGNLSLTARFLAPISLFALSAFSDEDYRQQTEQICLITILVSVFFAIYIPLNTSIIKENLCVSYGFSKAIQVFSIITSIISTITLFFHNKQHDFSQINTLGFFMIIIGYNHLFTCYTFAQYIAGLGLLSSGTAIYFTKLHQHYLWTD